MRPQLRAALWLTATLAVGVVLGMFLNGALMQRRDRSARPGPDNGGPANGPAGFVAEMERTIQVRDDAQRNQLRPFLIAADSVNRSIVDGARQRMGMAMDSLRAKINPMLDDEQRKRVAEIGGPMNNGGRGGRGDPPGLGFGGRGRGVPPDGRGRGGPPDGRGGPPPDGRGGPPPPPPR